MEEGNETPLLGMYCFSVCVTDLQMMLFVVALGFAGYEKSHLFA